MYSLHNDRNIGFQGSDTASVHMQVGLYARYSKLPSVGQRIATSSASGPVTDLVSSLVEATTPASSLRTSVDVVRRNIVRDVGRIRRNRIWR